MRQPPSGVEKEGMGRPQEGGREMHQSGRASSMPRMRLRPHPGTNDTCDLMAYRSFLLNAASPLNRAALDSSISDPTVSGPNLLASTSSRQRRRLAPTRSGAS